MKTNKVNNVPLNLTVAAAYHNLLGSPSRLRIILLLHHQGETTSAALAQGADLSTGNTSQHLGKLLAAGLVTVRRDGAFRYYDIAPFWKEMVAAEAARTAEP